MLEDLKKDKIIVAGPNTFGGTFAINAGELEAAATAAAAAEADSSVVQSDSKQALAPDGILSCSLFLFIFHYSDRYCFTLRCITTERPS